MPRGTQEKDPFDDDWGMPDAPATPNQMPDAPTQEGRIEFLKPQALPRETGTLDLTGVSLKPTKFSDVTLLVNLNGRRFGIGLKLFSVEYKKLKERFGANPADWHGELRYKVMPHKNNPRGFIAVR